VAKKKREKRATLEMQARCLASIRDAVGSLAEFLASVDLNASASYLRKAQACLDDHQGYLGKAMKEAKQ